MKSTKQGKLTVPGSLTNGINDGRMGGLTDGGLVVGRMGGLTAAVVEVTAVVKLPSCSSLNKDRRYSIG